MFYAVRPLLWCPHLAAVCPIPRTGAECDPALSGLWNTQRTGCVCLAIRYAAKEECGVELTQEQTLGGSNLLPNTHFPPSSDLL